MSKKIGVDVGTGNLIATYSNDGKKVESYKIKDAFFKLDPANFMAGSAMQFGEKMLAKSGANFIKLDGILHVLGDDAFKFAHLFHKECLRPMSKGVLNPNEPISALMVKELIRGIAGEAESDEDVLYYCTPAEPIDAEFDIVFHAEVLNGVFKDLGYKKINRMTEGLAVVYSECEDTAYTGLGISCGAGMVNIAYSFMGIPVFSFSITKSGDWIDQSAAKAVSETANVVQSVKEKGLDITNPKDNIEQAITIYYNALIDYIVSEFKRLYESKDKTELPNINQPINIVIAGGTSMIGGFVDRFKEKIGDDFPIPVGEVKLAKEPLYAVSNGLYNASLVASSDEKDG